MSIESVCDFILLNDDFNILNFFFLFCYLYCLYFDGLYASPVNYRTATGFNTLFYVGLWFLSSFNTKS